jgi:hypothetical protein
MPAVTRPLNYLDGLGAGIAAAATAVAWWLAWQTPAVAGMYGEFGDVRLPAITRLVLHPAWRWIAPTALVAALVVLHARRPPRGALLALAAVAVACAVLWYRGLQAPISELSAGIK